MFVPYMEKPNLQSMTEKKEKPKPKFDREVHFKRADNLFDMFKYCLATIIVTFSGVISFSLKKDMDGGELFYTFAGIGTTIGLVILAIILYFEKESILNKISKGGEE